MNSLPSRFTVPVLWDKKHETIVNNESSEILRIFNSAFNHLLPADKASVDLYPEELRGEIDSLNEWIYPSINSTLSLGGSTMISVLIACLQMVFTGPGLQARSKRMRRPSTRSSTLSIRSRES